MFMSYLSVNYVYVLSIGDLKDKTYMNYVLGDLETL